MSGAKQVGIVAAEIYFPGAYVDQAELEKHDGVSQGKYQVITHNAFTIKYYRSYDNIENVYYVPL